MSASPITDRYVTRKPKSAALNEAAKRSMPGGDTRIAARASATTTWATATSSS